MTNNSLNPNAYQTGNYSGSNSPSSCCRSTNQALQCCEHSQPLQNSCNKAQAQTCRSPRNGMFYYVSPTFYQNGNNGNCCDKNTKLESEPKPKRKLLSVTHDYGTVGYPKLTTCLQQCQVYLAKVSEQSRNENPKKVPDYGRSLNKKNISCENKENTSKLVTCPPEFCEIPCEKATSSTCCKKILDKTKDKTKNKSTTADYCNTLKCDDCNCCKDNNDVAYQTLAPENNKIKVMVSQLETKENYSVRKYITATEFPQKILNNIQHKDCSTDCISEKKIKLTCEKETCTKSGKCKRHVIQTSSEEVVDNTDYNDSDSDCCKDSVSNIAYEYSKNKTTRQTSINNPQNKMPGASHSRNAQNSPPNCCKNDIYNSAFKRDVSKVKDIMILPPKALSTSNIFGRYKPDWTNNKISKLAYSKEMILLEFTKKQSQDKAVNVSLYPASTEGESQVDVVTVDRKNSSNSNSQVRLEVRKHKEYLDSNEDVKVETVELTIESLFVKENRVSTESVTPENENKNGHEVKSDLDKQLSLQEIPHDEKGVSTGPSSPRTENNYEPDKYKSSDKKSLAPDCCSDKASLKSDGGTDALSSNRKRVSIGSCCSRNENKNEFDENKKSDENPVSDSGTNAPSSGKKRVSIGSDTSRNERKNEVAGEKYSDKKCSAKCLEKKKGNVSSTTADKHFVPCSHPLHKKQEALDLSESETKNASSGITSKTKIPCDVKETPIRRSLIPDCCVDKFRGKPSVSPTVAKSKCKTKPDCCNKKPQIDNTKSNIIPAPCKNGREQKKCMSDYKDCCKEKISSNGTRSLQMQLSDGLPKWLSCCKSLKCPVNDPTTSTYQFLLKTRLCCNHKDCKLAAQICDLYEPQNIKIHISKSDNFGDLEYHYLATDVGTAYDPMFTEPEQPNSNKQQIVNEPTIGYVATVGYVPNIQYGSQLQYGDKKESEVEGKKIESSAVEMYSTNYNDDMYRESVFIHPEEKTTSREKKNSLTTGDKDEGKQNPGVNIPEVIPEINSEEYASQERRTSTVSWSLPPEQEAHVPSSTRLEIDISMSTAEVVSQATADANKFRQHPQPNIPPAVMTDVKMSDEHLMKRLSSANMSEDTIVKSQLEDSLKMRESKHHSNW